jgi:hypothetical protein
VPIFIALPERGVTVHSGDMGYTMGPLGGGQGLFERRVPLQKSQADRWERLATARFPTLGPLKYSIAIHSSRPTQDPCIILASTVQI